MNAAHHIVTATLMLLLLASPTAFAQEAPDPELRSALLEAVNTASSFDDRYDAEVWLTDMSARLERQVRDHDERMGILTRVHQEATFAGLAPGHYHRLLQGEGKP